MSWVNPYKSMKSFEFPVNTVRYGAHMCSKDDTTPSTRMAMSSTCLINVLRHLENTFTTRGGHLLHAGLHLNRKGSPRTSPPISKWKAHLGLKGHDLNTILLTWRFIGVRC